MPVTAKSAPKPEAKIKAPQWAEAHPDVRLMPDERKMAFFTFMTVNQQHFAKEITEKMDRGWLRPFLFAQDALLTGRWLYWTEIKSKGHIRDAGPIPQINFISHGSGEYVAGSHGIEIGRKMLKKMAGYSIGSAERFIDWFLWALGDPQITDRPRLDSGEERFFYENFDLAVLMANPTDYFSSFASDEMRQSGLAGYFPTPLNICILMTQMQMGVTNGVCPANNKTVMDPCVGAGAMLLPASNYSLRLYGSDINLTMIKLTRLHMWLFAPWGITGDGDIDWNEETTALPEPIALPEPVSQAAPAAKDTRPKKHRNLAEFDLDINPTLVVTVSNKEAGDA